MKTELPTIKEYFGKPYLPRIYKLEDILSVVKATSKREIEKAIKIIKSNGSGNMTKKIQKDLVEIGFIKVFRGFNSWGKDTHLYFDGSRFYFSIGLANINKAGRGYEIPVELTKKGIKEFISKIS